MYTQFCFILCNKYNYICSFLLTAVPSQPGQPEVSDIRKNSVVLTWQQPDRDGGKPITGYVIERKTGVHWIPCKIKAKHETMKVEELVEDNKYEFRILAENEVGLSKPSSPSVQITARDPWKVPGQPGTPQVSNITSESMTVEWTKPDTDGGCPIDGYILEYKLDSAFKWLRASSSLIKETMFVVKGLMEDMKYEFRVAAENKAGAGPYSGNSSPVKATTPLGM